VRGYRLPKTDNHDVGRFIERSQWLCGLRLSGYRSYRFFGVLAEVLPVGVDVVTAATKLRDLAVLDHLEQQRRSSPVPFPGVRVGRAGLHVCPSLNL
jgi:hypothetical protein